MIHQPRTPLPERRNSAPSPWSAPAAIRSTTGLPRRAPTCVAVASSGDRWTWCRAIGRSPSDRIAGRNFSTVPWNRVSGGAVTGQPRSIGIEWPCRARISSHRPRVRNGSCRSRRPRAADPRHRVGNPARSSAPSTASTSAHPAGSMAIPPASACAAASRTAISRWPCRPSRQRFPPNNCRPARSSMISSLPPPIALTRTSR
jgi:hypothetical protein